MFLKTLMSLSMVLTMTSANLSDNSIMQTMTAERVSASAQAESESQTVNKKTSSINAKASTISVSSVKITWNAVEDHKYVVSCIRAETGNDNYSKNIRIKSNGSDSCFITGLRENSMYIVSIKDTTENEEESVFAVTEKVTVLETYDYVAGWTNCFAYEAASGLTENPSKAAIENAIIDPVTNTGIMRNKYGDYCVAMGLWYGDVGDRFLVELENGTQFTVQICDSKGKASDGKGTYHTFGHDRSGKCIIEFIHCGNISADIRKSGNFGDFAFDGLIFDNIASIQRIEYGNPIEY